MDALRNSGAVAPDDPLATLAPAPTGGHAEFLHRLIEGIERLAQPVLLVLDDLHERRSPAAMAGVEHLISQSPARLRTLVVSRRDLKLGLHRLRPEGRLTEIRSAELEFTPAEAAQLLGASRVAAQIEHRVIHADREADQGR